MPIIVHFGEFLFLKSWSLRSNCVTRQVSLNRTKIGGKCQNSKILMRHFEWFSNTVILWCIFGRNWISLENYEIVFSFWKTYLSLTGISNILRNAENIPKMDLSSNPNKGNSTLKNSNRDQIRVRRRRTKPKSSTTYPPKSKILNFPVCYYWFPMNVGWKPQSRQFQWWEALVFLLGFFE